MPTRYRGSKRVPGGVLPQLDGVWRTDHEWWGGKEQPTQGLVEKAGGKS